jgi:cobalt-zinc-cadmium efflux system outer membrane protein
MQRLKQSPLLMQASLEVSRREALQQVERSRQIGDLTVNVGTKRDREADRNQLIVGLSIPLPLFDRNQGNVQQAMHQTDKARSELAATEIQLQTDLIQAHERLTTLHNETAVLLQEILPNAQSAYQAAVTGFELGKFNFLDLLDAQRTLFQTKTHYLNTLSETHRAAADIARLVGTDAFTH